MDIVSGAFEYTASLNPCVRNARLQLRRLSISLAAVGCKPMVAGLQVEPKETRCRCPSEWRSRHRGYREFSYRDGAAEARADRWRGLDTGIVALCVEADLVVDDHAHAVEPDLPDDLVPVRGGDETLVLDTVLLRR